MTRTTDFAPDDLDTLVADLKDAGIRDVSLDPATLKLPGVWVNVAGFSANLLAGLTVKVDLVCLCADQDPRRALVALAPLFNLVTAALVPGGGPSGDPVTGSWVLPGSTTPLPGISIPFDLLTTQES